MAKPGFRGRKKGRRNQQGRTFKAQSTRKYTKIDDRPPPRSIPTLTSTTNTGVAVDVAAASVATDTTPTTTTTSPSTLPPPPPITDREQQCRPPQRKTAARATEMMEARCEDDEPGSATFIDAQDAFIDEVCKDQQLKNVDKDLLVRIAIIHIYVCVLGCPPQFDEEGNEQWSGKNNIFSKIRTTMPGWKEEEQRAIVLATITGNDELEARRVYRNGK